jgi:hypothetical protein
MAGRIKGITSALSFSSLSIRAQTAVLLARGITLLSSYHITALEELQALFGIDTIGLTA